MTDGSGTPAPPRRRAPYYVGPVVLYATYIFVMGSVRDGGPPLHVSDKTAHFIAFGLMVPLVLRALVYFRPSTSRVRLVAASALIASLVGALLEVWQAFLPYRSSELLDWVADTVGAAIAAVLTLFISRALAASRPISGGP